MGFKYTQEWAEELLHLYRLENADGDEEERIYELLEMAEWSNDVRVARVLIECDFIYIEGVNETVRNTLNTMNYKIYFEGFFSDIRKYIDKSKDDVGGFLVFILDAWYATNLTQEELETVVFPLAKKYLTKEDMKRFIGDLEKWGSLGNNSITDQFYAFFNKELDANWTPPPQEEVEPISEEEMQKYKDYENKSLDELLDELIYKC